MDDLHKARHWLCNKGACKSSDTTNNSRQQKLKHLLRYIKGTQHYKTYIRPTTKTPTAEAVPDIQVFVDSDWAGCATTRKVNNRFLIKVFGATIHYGSRTQATIALSSAEAELYAINTGATEALHISNFMKEALNMKKINIRIHTDSSSGKSMATRIGASKKDNTSSSSTFLYYNCRTRSCEDCQDQHDTTTRPTFSQSTLQQRRFCVTSVMLALAPSITEQTTTPATETVLTAA